MLHDLLFLFGVVMATMLAGWRLAVVLRDVSFIDAIWAYGMVITVGAAAALKGGPAGPAGWTVLALVALWGLRLGTHLILRWRRLGRDPRYEKIIGSAMAKRGWSFERTALLQVFLLQGPLLWGVCLPAQLAVLADAGAPLPAWGWAGVALALFGIGFETIADAQLEAFRKNPAMRGRVLDTGLWRYTRHPNYFGDCCAWWGIFIASLAAGASPLSIIGPLFLTFTLTRWSGAPMLEHGLKKHRPGYADYIARTSGFFPLPPKR